MIKLIMKYIQLNKRNIFRGKLTQYELEAFFYNCLSQYGESLFNNLVGYKFFEHMSIEGNIYDK